MKQTPKFIMLHRFMKLLRTWYMMIWWCTTPPFKLCPKMGWVDPDLPLGRGMIYEGFCHETRSRMQTQELLCSPRFPKVNMVPGTPSWAKCQFSCLVFKAQVANKQKHLLRRTGGASGRMAYCNDITDTIEYKSLIDLKWFDPLWFMPVEEGACYCNCFIPSKIS